MSDILTCPDCDTKLKLKAPLLPGKKVRCPKCSTLFAPMPEAPKKTKSPVDKAPIATTVSKGRRKPVAVEREEEEEDERPRRRQSSTVAEEDSEEPGDDERPRRSRKKRPRKSGNRRLLFGLVIGGGVLCFLLILAGIVVAVVMGHKDPYKENEAAMKEMLTYFEEFATTMESIKDPQSAKTGAERINKICDRMEKVIARVVKLPKLTPAQNERLKNEMQPRIDVCVQRIARVAFQVQAATQGEPTFQAALQRMQQVSNRLKQPD